MRDILLIVHIISIALWLGGSIMNGVINMNVMKQNSLDGSLALARAEAKLGLTFYMPMSILAFVTGIALVVTSDGVFSMGDPWVSFGMLTVIVAAVLGPVKLQPLTDKMIAQYEAGDLAAGTAAGMEIGKWSTITTALLVISTILMVVKP